MEVTKAKIKESPTFLKELAEQEEKSLQLLSSSSVASQPLRSAEVMGAEEGDESSRTSTGGEEPIGSSARYLALDEVRLNASPLIQARESVFWHLVDCICSLQ